MDPFKKNLFLYITKKWIFLICPPLIRNVYNSCQVLYVQCKMRVLILGLVFRALLSQSIIVDRAGGRGKAEGEMPPHIYFPN